VCFSIVQSGGESMVLAGWRWDGMCKNAARFILPVDWANLFGTRRVSAGGIPGC
jgi:hypothetical protein